MLRAVMAAVFAASCANAYAADCAYESSGDSLYFVSPMTAVVETATFLPYACSLSSAGTGINGRAAHCSDGFEGGILWLDDARLTFRGREWVCTDTTEVYLGLGK